MKVTLIQDVTVLPKSSEGNAAIQEMRTLPAGSSYELLRSYQNLPRPTQQPLHTNEDVSLRSSYTMYDISLGTSLYASVMSTAFSSPDAGVVDRPVPPPSAGGINPIVYVVGGVAALWLLFGKKH